MPRKARTKIEDRAIFFPYTCPGCNKNGSVGFTLGSLPYDFNCSACGTPTHVRREDDLTVTLTFDTNAKRLAALTALCGALDVVIAEREMEDAIEWYEYRSSWARESDDPYKDWLAERAEARATQAVARYQALTEV